MKKYLGKALYKLPNLLWPSHSIKEYAQILDIALDNGYHFYTLGELHRGLVDKASPFMILRHDIDTNSEGALRFAEIEASRSISASYFFRLSTWHPEIISRLQRRGFELGYHFEELSAYAIRMHLKNKQDVISKFPEIKKDFQKNITQLRSTVDFELNAIAAHGDFAYPVLDLGNRSFMHDPLFRIEMAIAYEAYDEHLVLGYGNHLSDKPAPLNFHPMHPLSCIQNRENLLLLTHPRWWIPDGIRNIKSDLSGYWQKLRW